MLRVISVILLCVIIINDARKSDDKTIRKYRREFEEFVEWKRTKQHSVEFVTRKIGFDDDNVEKQDPPSPDHATLMARYVVNQADWTAVSTISTRTDVESFPIANLISVSDGIVGNGTGIPYMYLTPFDFTAQDLAIDNRASLLMSLAQQDYCKNKDWDPMDPRCARVILTGIIKALKNGTKEYEIGRQLFFGRHPKLENMPPDHKFFLAKLKILAIALLDHFGGPIYINVNDYLHPKIDNVAVELQRRFGSFPVSDKEIIQLF